MSTIDIIQKIADEIAVIREISKELPQPYSVIVNQKIIDFNSYLAKALTLETENNSVLQNYASDLLTELENQQFEE